MTQICLDITRSLSRVGVGHATGIDRVELAYLGECITRFEHFWCLGRLGKRTFIFDRTASRKLLDVFLDDSKLPLAAGLDQFRYKLDAGQRQIRSLARDLCCWSGKYLSETVSDGSALFDFTYLNVGHSNLDEIFLSNLKKFGASEIHVLLHDLIPLTHPQYTRFDTVQKFRQKIWATAKFADRIICNSEWTKTSVENQLLEWNTNQNYSVSLLGIEPFWSVTEPSARRIERPYFVTLGTIEPRKNHKILLDVWEDLWIKDAQNCPELHIVGRRGWNNVDIFDRLDQFKISEIPIFEHIDMDDPSLKALMSQSSGLLFPSFVEGFGIPIFEAASMRLPLACSDIPVFKELLGDKIDLLDPESKTEWKSWIIKISQDRRAAETASILSQTISIPTWDDHFSQVFGKK